MITKLLYLLGVIAGWVDRHIRQQEQQAAQNERNKIDEDSAQHAADKFGDGRVRGLGQWRADADEAKRSGSDRG